MIIGLDSEYQFVGESVYIDFEDVVDTLTLDELMSEKYENAVVGYDEFIPLECIPTELHGVDTDNMTEDQEEMLREAEAYYISRYQLVWRDKVANHIREQLESLHPDSEEYNELQAKLADYTATTTDRVITFFALNH